MTALPCGVLCVQQLLSAQVQHGDAVAALWCAVCHAQVSEVWRRAPAECCVVTGDCHCQHDPWVGSLHSGGISATHLPGSCAHCGPRLSQEATGGTWQLAVNPLLRLPIKWTAWMWLALGLPYSIDPCVLLTCWH